MPTVIDSLIVELGIDASKFEQGQKKADTAFLKTKQSSLQAGKDIEASTAKMSDGFSFLQGKLLGIAAIFAGGMGIRQFGEHVYRLSNELTNLSGRVGDSAKELATWDALGARVGAKSGEVAGSIAQVRGDLAYGRLHGVASNQKFFVAMRDKEHPNGINPYLPNGKVKSDEQLMMEMATWAKRLNDPSMSGQLFKEMGLSPGTITLLMKGPEVLQKWLEEQKKLAPTDEQIRRFQELQDAEGRAANKAEALGRSIMSDLEPSLVSVLNFITDKFTPGIRKELDQFERGLHNIGEAFKWLWDIIKPFVEKTTAPDPQGGVTREWAGGKGDRSHVAPRGPALAPGTGGQGEGGPAPFKDRFGPSGGAAPQRRGATDPSERPGPASLPVPEQAPGTGGQGGGGDGQTGGIPNWYIGRLKKFEGYKSHPYWDYKQWTNGYGTRANGPGDVVDRAEAERRLAREVAKAAGYVDHLNPNLDPGTRMALADLAYNAGPGALKGIAGAIKRGDLPAIRAWLGSGRHYVTAGGRYLPQLDERRRTEAGWVGRMNSKPNAWGQGAQPVPFVTPHPGLMALQSAGNSSHNNVTSSTHVGNVNVYSSTDDPLQHGADIRAALQRNQMMNGANAGPQ